MPAGAFAQKVFAQLARPLSPPELSCLLRSLTREALCDASALAQLALPTARCCLLVTTAQPCSRLASSISSDDDGTSVLVNVDGLAVVLDAPVWCRQDERQLPVQPPLARHEVRLSTAIGLRCLRLHLHTATHHKLAEVLLEPLVKAEYMNAARPLELGEVGWAPDALQNFTHGDVDINHTNGREQPSQEDSSLEALLAPPHLCEEKGGVKGGEGV